MGASENDMSGLTVKFLPVYSKERKIVSCEVRPALSLTAEDFEIYPSHIIMQIAEEMGVDVMVNAWIINKACEFAVKTGLKVSVTASARAISTGDIVTSVRNALEETKLSPDLLAVQFPEQIVALNYDHFNVIAGKLKRFGVSVILDNLGAYTAAVLLRHSSVDGVKANASVFTAKTIGVNNGDDFDKTYLDSIMKLAEMNNVSVGVTSIHNEGQFELIDDVDWYQGELFSKELSEEEFLRKLS
jgi:EAL domain-containing protein (putative c-di-GMP-specific phosphodiesterase class I)